MKENHKDTETVFQGRIVRAMKRVIKLPNNLEMEMDVVEHPGGAAVVALNENQEICLLKQYRAVFQDWFWELPAGKRDHQEPPENTAKRELLEEAGVQADHWESLGEMVSSPGVFTERVFLYFASNLSTAEPEIAEDEIIGERRWVPFEQARQWAIDGTIRDAKTIIAIMRAVEWVR